MQIEKLEWVTENDGSIDDVRVWLAGHVIDDAYGTDMKKPKVEIFVRFNRDYASSVDVDPKKAAIRLLIKKTFNLIIDELPGTTPNWITTNDKLDEVKIVIDRAVTDTFSGPDQVVDVRVWVGFFQSYWDAVNVTEKRTAIRALAGKALNQAWTIL